MANIVPVHALQNILILLDQKKLLTANAMFVVLRSIGAIPKRGSPNLDYTFVVGYAKKKLRL